MALFRQTCGLQIENKINLFVGYTEEYERTKVPQIMFNWVGVWVCLFVCLFLCVRVCGGVCLRVYVRA